MGDIAGIWARTVLLRQQEGPQASLGAGRAILAALPCGSSPGPCRRGPAGGGQGSAWQPGLQKRGQLGKQQSCPLFIPSSGQPLMGASTSGKLAQPSSASTLGAQPGWPAGPGQRPGVRPGRLATLSGVCWAPRSSCAHVCSTPPRPRRHCPGLPCVLEGGVRVLGPSRFLRAPGAGLGATMEAGGWELRSDGCSYPDCVPTPEAAAPDLPCWGDAHGSS